MITTNKDQLSSTLASAVADLGGTLTAVGSDWVWQDGNQQIQVSPKPNSIHFSREFNEPVLSEQLIAQAATTLHGWLSKNTSLPCGHRIALQGNYQPAQQAILPTRVDTELEASDLMAILRSFNETDPQPAIPESPILSEAVESWAAEANVRLTTSNADEGSEPDFSIKLRGFEPARLDLTGRATLHIDASPLLETSADSKSDPATTAACSLLAIGATAPSTFIRPELTDDTLRYRATFGFTENPIPPAAWLAKAVQELTAALRASRIELEALHNNAQLANQYLAIRKVTLKS